MISLALEDGLKIHGIQAGTVAVKKPHREYKGLPMLSFPSILLSKKWTEAMPIWVWLIESSAGNFLIDTGENIGIHEEDYFGDDRQAEFVIQNILDIKITQEQQIDHQLAGIGLSTDDIDAVIMTHLHLDHTDGLKFFPNAEILIARKEWENPWGAITSTFPKWLSPKLIDYEKSALPFGQAFKITDKLQVVPTPGHTRGHQSVILETEKKTFFFAGDASFSDEQLQSGKVAGICISFKHARTSYTNILDYAKHTELVYLPSHDVNSGQRLLNQKTL